MNWSTGSNAHQRDAVAGERGLVAARERSELLGVGLAPAGRRTLDGSVANPAVI